jgi:uncharacterized protein YbjT (DUF2867 family)
MNAIIAGASGEVGKHLLNYLLEDNEYVEVISLVRSSSLVEHQKLNNQSIDFEKIASLPSMTADALFCCLGTTIKKAGSQAAFEKVDYEYVVNLAKWAKQIGVKQFHVVSAMGADANSNVFYSKVKGRMEEELQQIGIASTYIYRPSLLDSEREESRPAERIGILLFRLLRILFIGPMKKYASIKVQDVAKGMWQQSKAAKDGYYIIESDKI